MRRRPSPARPPCRRDAFRRRRSRQVRISGSGLTAPGIGAVALRGKGVAANEPPDEDRVVRSDKKGRLAKVLPVAPRKPSTPVRFSSSAVRCCRSEDRLELKMAFAKPQIKGEEVGHRGGLPREGRPEA